MALIRKVLQHPKTGKWAYIEYSDEERMVTILGNQEFDEKEDAIAWSEGFDLFSYERQDPKERKDSNERKRNLLIEEIESLKRKLEQKTEELRKIL